MSTDENHTQTHMTVHIIVAEGYYMLCSIEEIFVI